jgi:hypothetical protein
MATVTITLTNIGENVTVEHGQEWLSDLLKQMITRYKGYYKSKPSQGSFEVFCAKRILQAFGGEILDVKETEDEKDKIY